MIRFIVIPLLVVLPLVGCRGHASVHLVPLTTKKISPTAPTLLEVRGTESYYWIGDDGRLRVGIKGVSGAWAGKTIERNLHLSLLLDAPPAGAERMYTARKNTARLRAKLAPIVHVRSASTRGVVAVSWKGVDKPIEGRFRLYTRQQSFHALKGWSGDQDVLVTGSFHAVPNRRRGEAIFAYTEEGALARSPDEDPPQAIRLSPPREQLEARPD